jgi:hypothetical protein
MNCNLDLFPEFSEYISQNHFIYIILPVKIYLFPVPLFLRFRSRWLKLAEGKKEKGVELSGLAGSVPVVLLGSPGRSYQLLCPGS